jgi:hypothetical protein
VDLQLVLYFANSAYPTDRPQQVVDFVRQYLPVQGNATLEHGHDNCTGMRHDPPNGRPHPLVEHFVPRFITAESAFQLGRDSGGSIPGVSGGGCDTVTQLVTNLDPLIPKE